MFNFDKKRNCKIMTTKNTQLVIFRKQVAYRVTFVFYTILITVLSLSTGAQENSTLDMNSYGILYLDKISHALAYAIFAIQAFLLLTSQHLYRILCFAIALYGTLLELVQQTFIPSRMGSIEDAIANIVGVIIGYNISLYYMHSKK
nr:VanZ family protein [Photobacterium lutimaris]